MKCFRLLFLGFLLLQSLYSSANALDNSTLTCPLPAPAWITATNITTSSIKIKWADVTGATHYKVERFDVTHGVALPDAFTTEPEYTSTPHDPGTTISFEVSATSCGESGDYGESITGEYTTSFIIVDNIVFFTIPNPTQGDSPILPGSDSPAFSFSDANKTESTVDVLRLRVSYTENNVSHAAEFLLSSRCSNFQNGGPRVKYWNISSWQGNISYTENHFNENPLLPVMSITFKSFNRPFFTIYNPTLSGEIPDLSGGLTLHNDCLSTIYFARSVNTEHNPCYEAPPPSMKKGSTEANDEGSGAQDREAFVPDSGASDLNVHPNPFSDGFVVNYGLSEASPVQFTLLDQTGRTLQKTDLPSLPAGQYSTAILTNNLPTGLYLLAFQTNQGRTLTTLVKQN